MKLYTQVLRGGKVESIHEVYAVVLNQEKDIVFQAGDPGYRTFMRSAVKPFQAYTFVQSGAADAYEVSRDELAVCCASHNSEPVHIGTVRQIQERAGLSEENLLCGGHKPSDEQTADELLGKKADFTPNYNNCSGKHTAMLISCLHQGHPIEGYIKSDHPIQQQIIQYFESELNRENIYTGLDGCSVPTFYLSLLELASLFLRLPGGADKHYRRIFQAMSGNPYLVAGRERFDTAIMEYGKGNIVSKVGAEGLRGIGVRHQGGSYSMAVKVIDGAKRASAPVVLEVMRYLGWVNPLGKDNLMPYYRPVTRNHRDIEVGRIEPVLVEC